jgi:hypothetical protein
MGRNVLFGVGFIFLILTNTFIISYDSSNSLDSSFQIIIEGVSDLENSEYLVSGNGSSSDHNQNKFHL